MFYRRYKELDNILLKEMKERERDMSYIVLLKGYYCIASGSSEVGLGMKLFVSSNISSFNLSFGKSSNSISNLGFGMVIG